jgi:hypothetical protein
MNLKNYTTEVPASRSIEYIERLLVEFGATNIMKDYKQGNCAAISFMIEMNGMRLPFRLPAKVNECFLWLKKKKPNSKDQVLIAQAERICWKQMHEWVYLQLSLIELDQLEKLEAFFPYLYDITKQETYFEKIKSGGFKALLPAAK